MEENDHSILKSWGIVPVERRFCINCKYCQRIGLDTYGCSLDGEVTLKWHERACSSYNDKREQQYHLKDGAYVL